jgi:hypothetical protein
MKRFLRDNSLGLIFLTLFVIVLAGQATAGHATFNQEQLTEGLEPISFGGTSPRPASAPTSRRTGSPSTCSSSSTST